MQCLFVVLYVLYCTIHTTSVCFVIRANHISKSFNANPVAFSRSSNVIFLLLLLTPLFIPKCVVLMSLLVSWHHTFRKRIFGCNLINVEVSCSGVKIHFQTKYVLLFSHTNRPILRV